MQENPVLAEGNTTFDLPLGPLRVRVVDLPADEAFVEMQYAPFWESPSGEPDLIVHCKQGSGVVIPVPPAGEMTVLDIDELGEGRFDIRSHWQSGWVDVGQRAGEITLTDRRYIQFRMSLENYLRVACQMLLIERNAFLMHTAGIVNDGRCFLMFGPSGAGKSTATQNSEPRPALSDDMVLIEVDDEKAVAHAVPFYGAFPPHERLRGVFPIAAACRLRQHPANKLEPIQGARAVATVSASIPFVHELGIQHEGLTALVGRFCERVPACELYLTNSPDFWNVLSGAFAA